MEEGFSLAWEDTANVVQNEEVICDIEDGILRADNSEFSEVCEEVVVQEDNDDEDNMEENEDGNIMYLTDDNVIVMQPASVEDEAYQVTEVIGDQWNEECTEIVVGSEENIGTEEQTTDDVEIPLPTNQDQYTAARPYPCDFCSRRFRKKANLMNHMIAHQTDRPYGCNLCGVRYIRKCDLMNHLKIHAYIPDGDAMEEEEYQTLDESDTEKARRKAKPFMKKRKGRLRVRDDVDSSEDRLDGNSRSYAYVDEDMRLMEAMKNYLPQENHPISETRYPISDPKKPFVCQHCGVGFAREKALASHSRVHGGDSPFECRTCGEVFWDADLIREHVRIKHDGVEQEYEEDDEDDEDYSDEDTRFGQFFCPTCGLTFHRQDNLKRHQRIHIKEEFSNEAEFAHVCNVCGDSFPEALELLAHAEVHARSSEHRCMICGEVYGNDEAVAEHVQVKHGKNLPPNTCLLCGRTCKDRRTLLKHSFEHSKEKSFACTKCEKTFHNKARLKRHMISHRNKAVTCDVCGADFPDGRSLMNHRHSHSSVSGRQFPCRECGKTFGSRSSQQIHIRIHTGERPYGCRFCWKAFADGGTLRKHERIHTGEKPYACAVCPRAFNQRVVLREHIRSHHSGPDPQHNHSTTPYCCAVCSDLFSTSQDLIVHLIHHCDLNTAMKRQPQIGPRKYKRRRKLKPHELEMMSNRTDGEEEENFSESDDDREYKRKIVNKKQKKSPPKPANVQETYNDVYNPFNANVENMGSPIKAAGKTKRKPKPEAVPVPSRPKMIHTQKAKVQVDAGDGTKFKHKTKTLVTHTQPTELKSATGERIRPRTKNVSYHIIGDKLPLATFADEDDAAEAVNNLLQDEASMANTETIETEIIHETVQNNGIDNMMDVASEQIIEEESPVPTGLFASTRTTRSSVNNKKKTNSPVGNLNNLKPGRNIIGPGNKVVRWVKGGMIVKNKSIKIEEVEHEGIVAELQPIVIKEEIIDSSPLHELAELSVQHAQSNFKCEMCSETFTDREQLVDHVPIHI